MPAPRKLKATIKEINYYDQGITKFILKPDFKCRFKSGQFLHFALDPYDPSYNWPDSRVFSIASSSKKEELEILVSPKGDFTNRMVNSLRVDQEVWLKLPFGDFNLNDPTSENIVLIAGGTGISPFIGFLEELSNDNHNDKFVCLYYGVRSENLIIYEALLKEIISNNKNFRLKLYIENQDVTLMTLPFTNGIIDLNEIIVDTKELKNKRYYISGSPSLISTFIEKAKKQRIKNDEILFDKWE